MPQFFIQRPVFAWVVALFIILVGVIAIPKLPIARYPSVAPPSVSINASYPGATPQTLNDAVLSLIERELSSVKNMLYFESSADTSGSASITAPSSLALIRNWRRSTCRTNSRPSRRACPRWCARTASRWSRPRPASC